MLRIVQKKNKKNKQKNSFLASEFLFVYLLVLHLLNFWKLQQAFHLQKILVRPGIRVLGTGVFN